MGYELLKELDRISQIVDISAVGYACDADYFVVVIGDVHNAVIPDADTSKICVTAQFLSAGRSWVVGQTFNPRNYPRDQVVVKVV